MGDGKRDWSDSPRRNCEKYDSDDEIITNCLPFVNPFSFDDTNREAMGQMKAWTAVLRAMSTFPDAENVQDTGFLALVMGVRSPANRDGMARSGAVRVVLNAIALLSGSEDITWRGSSLMSMMLETADGRVLWSAAEMEETKAAAMAAMKRFPSNTRLKERCASIV